VGDGKAASFQRGEMLWECCGLRSYAHKWT
jgi:hypothetical protein